MFDLSLAETAVIIVVGLLVIGPEEIPALIRSAIKAIRSLKYWANSLKDQVAQAVELDEIKDITDDMGNISAKRFILDDEGNYREVYDVPEIRNRKSEIRK